MTIFQHACKGLFFIFLLKNFKTETEKGFVEKTEFLNSIEDWVFATVKQWWQSSWKHSWLPSLTIVKKWLHLWCNKSNIRYIFCNKPLRLFVTVKCLMIILLLCLQEKTYLIDVTACYLFFTDSHLFLYSIYSLQV